MNVGRNSIYYFCGLALQKAIAFFYFVFLARALGVDNFGKYAFALSFGAILAVLFDLGANQLTVRIVAQEKEKSGSLVGSLLIFKMIVSACVAVIFFIALRFLPYDEITKQMIGLAMFVVLFDVFSNVFWAVLRGLQNMKYEAISVILYQGLIFFLNWMVVRYHLPLYYTILSLVIASFLNMFFGWAIMRRFFKTNYTYSFDELSNAARRSFSFFVVIVAGTLYSYIDVVALGTIGTSEAVGLYSSGQKIPNSLRIIPIALSAALYGAASVYYKRGEQLIINTVVHRALSYLMLFAVPVAVGLFFLPHQAVNLIFGSDFYGAGLSLKIMALSVPLISIDYVFFTMLNAVGCEKYNAYNRGFGALLILAISILLVPRFQHVGTAWATFASIIILNFVSIFLLRKKIQWDRAYILKKGGAIIGASSVMGLIVFLLRDRLSFFEIVGVGVFAYAVLIYFFKAVTKKDIVYLWSLLPIGKLKSSISDE